MKTYLLFLAAIAMICSVGCVTHQTPGPAYVWNDYSSSLYAVKKSPGEESLNKHKQVLLSIIEDSRNSGCRVPPGVYCEYGYVLFKEGKGEEAVKYFELEKQLYPESSIFVENLKTLATKATRKNTVGDEPLQTEGDTK